MAKKKATTKAAKRPRGRPSTFSEDVAQKILERLGKGEPLAAICRDESMPAVRTVSDWKAARPSFSAAFTRAREEGFDAIAADCMAIAEDGSRDFAIRKRPDGTEYEQFDAEHVQRSKLRIETRLKLLAKWDPNRYGEKVQIEANVGVHTLTDEQIDRKVASIVAAAAAGAAKGSKDRAD